MQYRELGKTGKRISIIGFGCMRLPQGDEEAVSLIQRAIDLDMNYFETSIGYCNGRSEIQVGLGVKDRRDDIYVSTKSFVSSTTTGADTKRQLEESLKKLVMDRVDFYQLWSFKLENLPVALAEGGPLEVLKEAKDKGLIDHLGFTSHDTPQNIIEILKTGEFESVTVYHNILQTRGSNPEPAIKYAYDHGIGVVIMGPLGGGILATPSEQLQALIPKTSTSTVELAFRYLLSNRGITTCISGMTKMADVEENARIASCFKPLAAIEMEETQRVLDHYKELGNRFCTGCGYCVPCPNGVDIPGIFKLANYARVYGLKGWARKSYQRMEASRRANNCTECGECEEKCPNGIPIREQLKEAETLLA